MTTYVKLVTLRPIRKMTECPATIGQKSRGMTNDVMKTMLERSWAHAQMPAEQKNHVGGQANPQVDETRLEVSQLGMNQVAFFSTGVFQVNGAYPDTCQIPGQIVVEKYDGGLLQKHVLSQD